MELKDFKDSTDMISVMLVKTDLGVQTVLYAYPAAGKREEHADEGYKVIYEKELYELPLLERCARSGYIMTKEEEKQVEKEVKEYFSIKENKFARDIALNFGPDMISQSTKVEFTPEEYEKFQQMYLLYRKTSDKDAFSYAFYSNFLLTKPFTYGGIVDRLLGYPENGSHEREYLEMAAEQNSGSYMIGSIAGGGASYATGSAAMKKVPGVGKLLTKAGEKLSKVPVIGKFGAESLTNILADTTLDTAIDTIPSMVELAMDGESTGEVALEGLKRTGINLGANGAFEAVFKVGKGVLGRTGGGGLKKELQQYVKSDFDGKGLELQQNFNQYLKENVWCRTDLSNQEKIDIMKANFDMLTPEQKVDFNVIADARAIKNAEYSNWGEFPDIDWPSFPGLDTTKSIYGVNKNNITTTLDRIGYVGGKNFGIISDNGYIYTQSERAIVYIDNKYAYHQYELVAEYYFEAIDCIKNSDYDSINKLIDAINADKGLKIEYIDEDIMERYNTDFLKFQNNPDLKELCKEKGIDSTYGVFGEAAPWYSSSGDKICDGGAQQLNTPVSGQVLKDLGILIEH